jgi:HK97 family phage prohead protease
MTVATATMLPDFTGYATRFDRECSDGRTIKHGAFAHQDKEQVPLVWMHQHDSPGNVLGHAILHHREDGVYTEAYFNETTSGQEAKELVRHGDIKALSIFANRLKQNGANVVHGNITEVSLVYKGANPEAFILDVNLQHSGDGTDTMFGEVIIHWDEAPTVPTLEHKEPAAMPEPKPEAKDGGADETVADIVESMTPKQKTVLYALVSQAASGDVKHMDADEEGDVILHVEDSDEEIDVEAVLESLTPVQMDVFEALIGEALSPDEESNVEANVADSKDSAEHSDDSTESEDKTEVDSDVDSEKLQHNQEGSANMKYTAFDSSATGGTAVAERKTLSHADVAEINSLAKEKGSFKKAYESFTLNHADYGIENIDVLFPDARVSSQQPELISRQTEWVAQVLGATKHSPFAKVKTILADLTAEEARAKGYTKGTLKKDEVVVLLQRSTSPATIYKKQKLDRDDVIDITDIDIITWLKWEIRFMLNEEIARAVLIGDGRNVGHADKIKDPQGQTEGTGIRSIANDHDLYAHKVQLAANVSPDVMIDEITRARTNYRGSGSPVFYSTDANLTEMLLLKDKMGRRLYETEAALASAIRVKEIVPVEPMGEDPTLIGIIVNLIDYTLGTNKGGEITSFEDFDIDFNQYKYLMETRMSGALTKPKSALVIRRDQGIEATATAPTFVTGTNTITIPTVTGVEYTIDGEVVTGSVVITVTTDVVAEPITGYYLAPLSTRNWTFSYTAP